MFLQIFQHGIKVFFALKGPLLTVNGFDYLLKSVAHVNLNVAELLVAFIFEHLGEETNLVVLS